jgi:hypothetical protein
MAGSILAPAGSATSGGGPGRGGDPVRRVEAVAARLKTSEEGLGPSVRSSGAA